MSNVQYGTVSVEKSLQDMLNAVVETPCEIHLGFYGRVGNFHRPLIKYVVHNPTPDKLQRIWKAYNHEVYFTHNVFFLELVFDPTNPTSSYKVIILDNARIARKTADLYMRELMRRL
jgi:hypothetical protein